MLSNTLVTNEVKDASATEVEFERIGIGENRTEFKQKPESPNNPHRLTISFQETGAGINRRRRSVVRFDKSVASDVDAAVVAKDSAYIVVDQAIGAQATQANVKNVLAELMSFVATTGAATTVLFDCTGNGAQTLINGTL